jgi:hypothetical protein
MSNEGKPELRSGAREPAVRRFQALLQACEWALRGATVFIFAGCGVLGSASVAHCQTQNTCLDCHSKLITQYKVSTENLVSDVHYQKGLSCTTCHGVMLRAQTKNERTPQRRVSEEQSTANTFRSSAQGAILTQRTCAALTHPYAWTNLASIKRAFTENCWRRATREWPRA